MDNDVIKHWGILGMKWGIRRYQNPDGSLTEAGRRRAQKLKKEFNVLTGKKLKNKIQSDDSLTVDRIKNMSDKELKDKITRLTNERTLTNLINESKPQQIKRESFMKRAIKKVWSDVALPSMIDAGKSNLTAYLKQQGSNAIGLNKKSESQIIKQKMVDAENKLKTVKFENEYKNLITKPKTKENISKGKAVIDDMLGLMDTSGGKDKVTGPKGTRK